MFKNTFFHKITLGEKWSIVFFYSQDVKLNGQTVESGAENAGQTGDRQCLSVGVTNASGDVLPPLTVFMTAFQDHQNGTYNYKLDAKMATTGATKFGIPKVGYLL